MDTIPNGHHPEWTPFIDTIPNGHYPKLHHPEWTPSQMVSIRDGAIWDGVHSGWCLFGIVFFGNGLSGMDFQEWIVFFGDHPEWTPSRTDTIPNGHNPEWTPSRMDIIPNGHNPEWTQSRMYKIPNGQNPEWTQSRMNTYNYIVALVFYNYCLVRSLLQRDLLYEDLNKN